MRRSLTLLLLLLAFATPLDGQPGTQPGHLPLQDDSLKFAVIGDSGTGDEEQLAVAKQLAGSHARFPFELALMLGDNLYGRERPGDYEEKFERPYKPLLDAGVKFYASLGNHDEPSQRFYKPFNMNGERYYTFSPKNGVRFFALDSNLMDRKQLEWLEQELAASGSDWKICFFHHPPYSSGDRHGSDEVLREQLEPLFVQHGVTVVFTGHEHFYERIKPQKGIVYFIVGSSAKLRRGDIEKSSITAKGYDEGYTFLLAEIAGDEMYFQTVSHKGDVIDSGGIPRVETSTSRPKATGGTTTR
jgi:3',5'-cyclic AMP phosphodiesterase CpdA